jgi:NAD(P)-dependent dehydrogenase (short-subunit alcohol dehydrogenase family)
MRQAMRRLPFALNIEPAPQRRLAGKAALVALGEGGIGRAVALAFAREGADLAIIYFNDHREAEETRQLVLLEGTRCILLSGDATKESFCRFAVRKALGTLGRLDVLVNDASTHCPCDGRPDIGKPEVEEAFRANLLGMFYLTQAAAPRLCDGGAIINTTSAPTNLVQRAPLTGYVAVTKRATVAFTRSLADTLRRRGIRVNAVDPADPAGSRNGPVRGNDVDRIVPSYVSLAARDSAFPTGQVLHPAAGRSPR